MAVNVIDLTIMVGHLIETYHGYFCFYNADVVKDGEINIQDIVAGANIILNGKITWFPSIKSNDADIFINQKGITLKSDGTITGLQFELTNIEQAVELFSLLPSHQVTYKLMDGKVLALIYNLSNTPIQAGEVEIVSFRDIDYIPGWGEVLAVNTNADLVPIHKHTEGLTTIQPIANSINLMVYPNPARETINLTFVNDSPKPVSVSLISIHGQKLKDKEVNQKGPAALSFDISKMPAGAYLVRIEYNGQVLSRVVIVE
jgi:hypothetical protein